LTVVVLPFKQRVAGRTSPAGPAITLGWVKRRWCDHVTIPGMGKKQGKHKQHDADDPAPAGTLQPHSPATKQGEPNGHRDTANIPDKPALLTTSPANQWK
jgi:hypothetical protein